MKNTQNITIAILTVTAAIMLAVLLGSFYADRAQAGAPSIKQGDYIMGTCSLSGEKDMLLIIDLAMRRLNVYRPNINTGSMEMIDKVDLERVFSQKP
jgi:hypothetical protein